MRWTILNVIDYSRANFIRPPLFWLRFAGWLNAKMSPFYHRSIAKEGQKDFE